MIEILSKILSQYGFGVFMTIVMLIFFWAILKWVMKQQDKATTMSEVREKALFNIIEGHKEALENHTKQSLMHHEETKKAWDHNRQEHNLMIESLGRINGYQKP